MQQNLVWLVIFVAGLGVGALVAALWQQARAGALTARLAAAEQQLGALDTLRAENESLKVNAATLTAEQSSLQEKLQWLQSAQDTLRETFQALASQALKTNAEEFIKRAQDQLNTIAAKLHGDWGTQKEEVRNMMDPLTKSLKDLDTQVRALEEKREGAYQGVTEQMRQLFSTHQELQRTTTRLAQALKSSSTRGRWGELQLRRVVEMAGMVSHVDFDEQQTAGDGRPDMVVHMPNGGVLPVDAKTPMNSYMDATEAPDEDTRMTLLDAHAKAIRDRVRELGMKQYWQQFDHAPDFVVMFVPSDSCLSAAFERDAGILDYAIQQRVLPTSPVTLLALLKSVAYGWQQQQTAENARKIADEARTLYDRLSKFVEHFTSLGKHVNQTVQDYNKAVGSFEGRVLPSARRLREMGIGADDIATPAGVDHQARLPLPPEAGSTADHPQADDGEEERG